MTKQHKEYWAHNNSGTMIVKFKTYLEAQKYMVENVSYSLKISEMDVNDNSPRSIYKPGNPIGDSDEIGKKHNQTITKVERIQNDIIRENPEIAIDMKYITEVLISIKNGNWDDHFDTVLQKSTMERLNEIYKKYNQPNTIEPKINLDEDLPRIPTTVFTNSREKDDEEFEYRFREMFGSTK